MSDPLDDNPNPYEDNTDPVNPPAEPAPVIDRWYKRNLTEALMLDTNGNVALRTGMTGNITISGPVTIPGTVTVSSTPSDPVHNHLTEVGTSGILAVPYLPIGGNVNANVTGGNIRITELPSISGTVQVSSGNVNANVSGSVAVSSLPDIMGTVAVSGITGNIAGITALPAITGNVNANITGGNVNVAVSGNIAGITALPAITGNVNANITGGNVNANITGGNVNAAVSGTVAVSGITGNIAGITALPAITGTVAVSGITGNIAGITNTINANITGGNVNAAVTGTVAVSSVAGNVAVTQVTSPWIVSGTVTSSTSSFPAGSTDAFGRLRVSDPYTLFDTKVRYYDHEQFSTSATGGNVQFDTNSSTFTMNINGTSGSSVIRESKRVFAYQPGKSLLVLNTFAMNTPKTGLRQRVGYFGEQNGVFFENDGTYNYLVIRSYSTGILTEERVRQDAWNGDRLNGALGANNQSGITLYPDRVQILQMDIQWLGVGSVRCGFVIDGAYYNCHTFHHANVAGMVTTYMTTASLPLRYEITNTSATGGNSTMRQICSSVVSEGGYNAFAPTECFGTGVASKRLVTGGTYYPLVSIRLAPTRLDSIVLPRQVDVLSTTVNYYRFLLILNPTLTDATWAGTSQSGTIQYDTAATSFTGGTQLQSFYASSRSVVELGGIDYFQFQLGRTLAGISDIVTLVAAADNNNADVMSQLGIQEIL